MTPERAWIGERFESPESKVYVGLEGSDALALAAANGVNDIGVHEGARVFTAELWRDRLNLMFAEGVVVKAAFC